MSGAFRDIRHAFRLFLASKSTTIVVVATLALTIGANTALFSVIDAVWLNAVPYANGSKLVRIHNRSDQFPRMAVSWLDADDWKEQRDIFEDVAVISPGVARIRLAADSEPVLVPSPQVQPPIFRMLDERAVVGRLLGDADVRPEAPRVVVLSENFWRQRFGGDAAVVGRELPINGQPATVVGVAPVRLQSLLRGDIVRPLSRPAETSRGSRGLTTIARLREGVSLSAAQARLADVSARVAALDPENNRAWRAHVETMRDALVGVDVGRTLTLLGWAVGLVLLIGCTNVASLLLARTFARTGEVAVRAALGASRMRLTRQLLTESLVLAAIGSTVGLLLVYLTRDTLVAIMPEGIPRSEDIGINTRVLGFAILATVITAALSGTLPAVKLARVGTVRTFTGRSETRRTRRVSGMLLAAETALSLVVLIAAGLLVGSFVRLIRVDPGFNPANVILLSLSAAPPGAKTTPDDDAAVLDELRRLPYVRAAGAIDQSPLGGSRVTYSFTINGRPEGSDRLRIDLRRATPGYFATMGIPLRQGRDFTAADGRGAPGVVIINERAARTFWPGENPLDQQVRVGGRDLKTIVGIVGDVRHFGLDRDPAPELYRPYAQEPLGDLEFIVRVDQSPQQLLSSLIDPNRRLPGGRRARTAGTFDDQVFESVRAPRFRTLLFALLGALVLALTMVGVAGLTAHAVAIRTRELGIRLAIGARPGQVVSLLVRQSAAPVAIGCAAGAMMAWWSVRLLEQFVFGLTVRDPLTFGGAALLLLAAAFTAAWLPARTATRIEPASALRNP
jgi:putative ABC transport system permease protein